MSGGKGGSGGFKKPCCMVAEILEEAGIGIRPINNVVDITNYVLMETGHPLHAFDYDRLAGHAIVFKRAAEGDRFTTLDGKERTHRSDTLMICDSERPIAVAGVMGGANTEISDSTTNVLLESAYFNPSSIRRTSKARRDLDCGLAAL